MEQSQSIYIRLEDTFGKGRGALAQADLEEALGVRYPEVKTAVEVTEYQPYDEKEITNVPLAMVKRAAEDARTHNVTLSARVVPMSVTSQVRNAEMRHGILFIATAGAHGTGDCLYTPLNNDSELVDMFGQVLERLCILQEQVVEIFPIDSEVVALSRFIMSVLQKDSLALPKH